MKHQLIESNCFAAFVSYGLLVPSCSWFRNPSLGSHSLRSVVCKPPGHREVLASKCFRSNVHRILKKMELFFALELFCLRSMIFFVSRLKPKIVENRVLKLLIKMMQD